jgi:hypothetical protein
MDRFLKIIFNIILIIICWPVLGSLFKFFGIEPEIYGIYVAWFSALWLFFAILPTRKPNIFDI